MDLNRIFLIGRVGVKPEVRYTPSGAAICEVRLATSDGTKEKPVTNWHNINVWNKSGETAAKLLDKGALVCVEGSINYQNFETKAGVKQTRTVITAHNWRLISSPRAEAPAAPTEDAVL